MLLRQILKLILTTVIYTASTVGISAAEAARDSVAVIIGNRNYQDSDIPTVDFAHRDAEAFRLFAKNILKIRDENILFLKDATQARIEAAFGRQGNHRGKAFQYVRPEVSDLYVFYSGHGVPGKTDGRRYILPVDAEIETSDINGYPLDVLYENLSKIDARNVVVFLDACFTGNSDGGELIKDASGIQILPQTPRDQTSLTVLTAASHDQLASWDRENGHGLFTEYLLRGLYGKADEADFGDGDGQITTRELADYLKSEMRYRARRIFNREQVPTLIGVDDRVLVSAGEDGFARRPVLAALTPPPEPVKPLEMIEMDRQMFAEKNANVRAEPSTNSDKVALLPIGSVVEVTAKVADRNWFRVAQDGKTLGYVFAPLLDDERPVTTAVRPAPRSRPQEQSDSDIKPAKSVPRIKTARLSRNIKRHKRIRKILHDMGALLASQRYNREMAVPVRCGKGANKRQCMAVATSHLSYDWVRIHADRCALSASFNFEHDTRISKNGKRKGIYVRDKLIEETFYDAPRTHTRALDMKRPGELSQLRFEDGREISPQNKVLIYGAGQARFVIRKDWMAYVKLANKLPRLCYGE